MRSLDPEVNRLTTTRWRVSLGVAAGLMVLFAAVSTMIAVGYDESLAPAVCMWVGVACVVLALRSVPRTITAEERPALGRTASWIALGVLAFVGGPLALDRLGLVSG